MSIRIGVEVPRINYRDVAPIDIMRIRFTRKQYTIPLQWNPSVSGITIVSPLAAPSVTLGGVQTDVIRGYHRTGSAYRRSVVGADLPELMSVIIFWRCNGA
jgi:hypothetical protein